jgi:hypothetical protein
MFSIDAGERYLTHHVHFWVTELAICRSNRARSANCWERAQKRRSNIMQMTDMSTGMMLGMGLLWLLLIVFLVLGIAASIKYLRS